MALANMGFKDQNWSHLGEGETVERERGKQKERRRGRGRRWRSQASQGMELWVFGMETNLDYEFYEIWHVSLGFV